MVFVSCAYDQQGSLLNTLAMTDGILGLSSAKISLPSQLAGLGIIKNVVGHCLATEAMDGGYLFFGDDFVPYRQMAWVPKIRSNSMYGIFCVLFLSFSLFNFLGIYSS